MSPLRPPCLQPQPGSRQPVVSLSGCTRLTPVPPQSFLPPKEQTSDLGRQNLISASRVCLSYVLILATWARPGDSLTPNSGGSKGRGWGRWQALLFDHHSTQEPLWSNRMGRNQQFFSFFLRFTTSLRDAALGQRVLAACGRNSARKCRGLKPPKPNCSVSHIPFLT